MEIWDILVRLWRHKNMGDLGVTWLSLYLKLTIQTHSHSYLFIFFSLFHLSSLLPFHVTPTLFAILHPFLSPFSTRTLAPTTIFFFLPRIENTIPQLKILSWFILSHYLARKKLSVFWSELLTCAASPRLLDFAGAATITRWEQMGFEYHVS